jgi:multidrug efflux pump
LSARPAVYLVWGALALLVVPMWMLSAEELAPSARIRASSSASWTPPANATLDQTSTFTAAVLTRRF